MLKKKKLMIALGIVLAIIIVGVGLYFYRMNKYRSIVAKAVISDVDISKVPNGEYKGAFDAIIVAAEVTVQVNDGEITEIILNKHKTDLGQPAEVVVDRVIEEQSLMVDMVSGATNSSKVILKSIENALK